MFYIQCLVKLDSYKCSPRRIAHGSYSLFYNIILPRDDPVCSPASIIVLLHNLMKSYRLWLLAISVYPILVLRDVLCAKIFRLVLLCTELMFYCIFSIPFVSIFKRRILVTRKTHYPFFLNNSHSIMKNHLLVRNIYSSKKLNNF